MRRITIIAMVTLTLATLPGCAIMSTTTSSNDLYAIDNRKNVALRLQAEAEAQRLEAEARRAQWEARLAEEEMLAAERAYYASQSGSDINSVLVTDYNSAYARRLYGFSSPTYRLPSSYYDFAYSDAAFYASAYDPAFYNVMVSGDQVWVEPRYITSMFGSWGAVNVTFGFSYSPWNYGWGYRPLPLYYLWWGYPRYSWYDWNWNICYHPHHYYDYWWGHHHHHPGGYHPAPRPPQHRPGHGHDHVTGPGASAPNHNLNGGRGNAGTRYTSPTSNRTYGTTSVGLNSRTTGNSGINRVTRAENNSSTKRGSSSNFSSGTSNFRSSSSTVRSSSSSSNNRSWSSGTSNFRSRSSGSSNSSSRSDLSSGSSRSGGSTSSRR